MDLIVDEELHAKAMLGSLAPDEAKTLEANLVRDGGAYTPVLFWREGGRNLVVDGRHRKELCEKNGLPYATHELRFDSRQDAIDWMVNNQNGRRHSKAAIRKARGDAYEAYGGGARGANAAETVAKSAGVSDRTVRRDAAMAKAIDSLPKSVSDRIRSGKLKATDQQVMALADADHDKQLTVARDIRTGRADTLAKALANAGVVQKKAKAKKKKADEGLATISKDKLGADIPDKLRLLASDGWYADTAKLLRQVVQQAKARGTNVWMMPLSEVVSHLESAANLVSDAAFAVVCPSCTGAAKNCSLCRESGWMPAWAYNDYKLRSSKKIGVRR